MAPIAFSCQMFPALVRFSFRDIRLAKARPKSDRSGPRYVSRTDCVFIPHFPVVRTI
jgi:hypothetical protein